MDVLLQVDLIDGVYKWVVLVVDFHHKKSEVRGTEMDPLRACLAAEKAGEAQVKNLLPDWVRTALANNWRPSS